MARKMVWSPTTMVPALVMMSMVCLVSAVVGGGHYYQGHDLPYSYYYTRNQDRVGRWASMGRNITIVDTILAWQALVIWTRGAQWYRQGRYSQGNCISSMQTHWDRVWSLLRYCSISIMNMTMYDYEIKILTVTLSFNFNDTFFSDIFACDEQL